MIGEAVLVTAPTSEPVTLGELRDFLRIGPGNAEPAPTAPTVALANPAAAGNVDNGAHRYRVTFITADGETEGGAISAAVTVADKALNGKIELTAIPTGGTLVTSRKLYRTAAGGSTYLLLATLADNTTTVYTDNVADASLGAAVPATNTTADALLTSLRLAARAHLEAIMGRAFITQTWDLFLSCFPRGPQIVVPRAPLASVTGVYYTPTGTAEQTVSTDVYHVDTNREPGRIVLTYGQTWPSATLVTVNGVRVRFVAGRAGNAVWSGWEPVRTALKQLVAHWYAQPEPVAAQALTPVPNHIQALIANWRLWY